MNLPLIGWWRTFRAIPNGEYAKLDRTTSAARCGVTGALLRVRLRYFNLKGFAPLPPIRVKHVLELTWAETRADNASRS